MPAGKKRKMATKWGGSLFDSVDQRVAHDEADGFDIFILLGEAPFDGGELRAPARVSGQREK